MCAFCCQHLNQVVLTFYTLLHSQCIVDYCCSGKHHLLSCFTMLLILQAWCKPLHLPFGSNLDALNECFGSKSEAKELKTLALPAVWTKRKAVQLCFAAQSDCEERRVCRPNKTHQQTKGERQKEETCAIRLHDPFAGILKSSNASSY